MYTPTLFSLYNIFRIHQSDLETTPLMEMSFLLIFMLCVCAQHSFAPPLSKLTAVSNSLSKQELL